MCGIIGYLGVSVRSSFLIQGLRRLEYRGYDSAGLAIHQSDRFYLERRIGMVVELDNAVDDLPLEAGIAHTRWATHGGVTEENAHPHMSFDRRVVLVHNGIIENANQFRAKLIESGITIHSETDSETLCHMIAYLYSGKGPFGEDIDLGTKGNPKESIRQCLRLARGTWGLAIMFVDRPHEILLARNGSPLVVGVGEDARYIASDPHAILPFTKQVIFLDDGDLAHVFPHDVQLSRLDGGQSNKLIETLEEEWGDGEKGDFPHFMIKEIFDQPEAIRQCLRGRMVNDSGLAKLGGLEMEPKDFLSLSSVTLLGCGTSFHASSVGALAIERLARIPARAEIASEFRHRNPVIDSNALFFAVSQSGETADTLGAIREIKIKGGTTMGIVNVVGSSIARLCGRGVYIHSGPEMAVASTKAFSNMISAMYLFTLQAARVRTISAAKGQAFCQEFQSMPDKIENYLQNPGINDEIVNVLTQAKIVFFLGRGFSAPVAAEGALKLMEVAYIPCVAYPSGEMKHGPIALLEKGTPVIVIAPDDHLKHKTISSMHECRARGANIILIHTEGDPIADEGDYSIGVPSCSEMFSPLLTVLPLQLLSYKVGLALDRDIDRPRNLAKSVTVE
jgi:glucosamine--fructose-6-phosphate aminotransferase (isomerizing)